MKSNQIKNFKGYRWIVISPDLLGGKPTIKDTRISVSFVLNFLASGMTPKEISNDYPGFPIECIPEVLKFAAEHIDKVISPDVAA